MVDQMHHKNEYIWRRIIIKGEPGGLKCSQGPKEGGSLENREEYFGRETPRGIERERFGGSSTGRNEDESVFHDLMSCGCLVIGDVDESSFNIIGDDE